MQLPQNRSKIRLAREKRYNKDVFIYLVPPFELVVLFVTSKYIIQALYHIFYRVFGKHALAGVSVFAIFFTGVIVHELAHLLTAEILFVRSSDFEVAPKIESGSLRMGSVQVAKSDIFRATLIGVAPILWGTAILVSVLLLYINYFVGNLIIGLIVVWVVFVITNTMFSSKKDLEGSEVLVLTLLFLGLLASILFYLLKINPIPSVLSFLQTSIIYQNVRLVSLLLLIPVVINLVIFFLAKIIVTKIY